MIHVGEKIREYRRCARPVIFLNKSTEHPYSGSGSCFIVSYESSLFLITAKHIFNERTYEEITTFVSAESDTLMSFENVFSIDVPNLEDDDFCDIVVLKVNRNDLSSSDLCDIKYMDLELFSNNWLSEPHKQDYMVFGYPDLSREINSEEKYFYNMQKSLAAKYVGPAISECCHTLEVVDSNGAEDYNGFSGSPVISWKREINGHLRPSFTGIAIRSTKTSGKITFLESEFVRAVLEKASRS